MKLAEAEARVQVIVDQGSAEGAAVAPDAQATGSVQ